ncbi:MAG: hypothetical protein JWO54_888 [Candidatus Saccharibacteria bacterium]|nr:hypothetical protein [Candidatus Saccharibacteria bacterium]
MLAAVLRHHPRAGAKRARQLAVDEEVPCSSLVLHGGGGGLEARRVRGVNRADG